MGNPMIDRAGWQDPMEGECAYCGAQAYIVNPSSKARVMERFERSKITHADELLGAPTPQLEDPEKVPPLKAYVVWPVLASTRLDDRGYPFFHSDRIDGRKAASDHAHVREGFLDLGHDDSSRSMVTTTKVKEIPDKYMHLVDAEVEEAVEAAKSQMQKGVDAKVAVAHQAAEVAKAKAKQAEEEAKKAAAALAHEKEREED